MNYQQINLDEYSLSGAGGTALTYTHKQEKRLAKLFTPGFTWRITGITNEERSHPSSLHDLPRIPQADQ